MPRRAAAAGAARGAVSLRRRQVSTALPRACRCIATTSGHSTPTNDQPPRNEATCSSSSWHPCPCGTTAFRPHASQASMAPSAAIVRMQTYCRSICSTLAAGRSAPAFCACIEELVHILPAILCHFGCRVECDSSGSFFTGPVAGGAIFGALLSIRDTTGFSSFSHRPRRAERDSSGAFFAGLVAGGAIFGAVV